MQLTKVLGLALALACFAGVAQAQDYTMSASDGAPGGNTAVVSLDSSTGGNIQGWSYGLCNGAAVMPTSVVDGSTTATVGAGGMPPAFDTITLFPNGWTVGVVIDFLGCCTLAPGAGLEMNIATYDVSGLAPLEVADLTWCDATLGSPAVANVVVVSGASIPFASVDGSLTGGEPVPAWIYDASEETFTGAGMNTSTVGFSITDNDGPTDDTQGFSMGWSHTSLNGTAADVTAVNPAGDVAAIGGGAGPSFFGLTTFPGTGWTVGVVYAFLGGVFVQFPAGSPAAVAADYTYDVTQDDVITITQDNGLGSPPVANVVVVSGASFAADGLDGSITLTLAVDIAFIRGDCNDDGIVNIADAVWTLNALFQGGPAGPCAEACDANNDGLYDATDATYTLNWRFLDGPPPPAPFPACGIEAGADCAAYSNCP